MKIQGYALTFNQKSVDLGGFREVLLPSMVERTLRENIDVRLFHSHDASKLLARLSTGTLTIRPDHRGLYFTATLPDTTDGRDVGELVKRGDLSGASFGFRTLVDRWSHEGDTVTRFVEDAQIFELSTAAFPAYPSTSVVLASRSPSRPAPLQAVHDAIARGPDDTIPALRAFAVTIRDMLAPLPRGTAIRCRWNAEGERRTEVIPPGPVGPMARPHTTMPPASSASLAMLAAFQKQIEVELSL